MKVLLHQNSGVHTIHVNLVIMPLPASQHRASMIVVMDEWAFLLELFAGKFLMIISTVLPAGRQHVIEILSSIVGRGLLQAFGFS